MLGFEKYIVRHRKESVAIIKADGIELRGTVLEKVPWWNVEMHVNDLGEHYIEVLFSWYSYHNKTYPYLDTIAQVVFRPSVLVTVKS